MDEFSDADRIIKSLAGKWCRKMPDGCIDGYEDLVSEGWIIWIRCKENYDPSLGVKFTTYLYNAVKNRYRHILFHHSRQKRTAVAVLNCDSPASKYDYDDKNVVTNIDRYSFLQSGRNRNNPERDFMVWEAIYALAEVSVEFASFIADGVSEELYRMIRRRVRQRAFLSDRKSANMPILIEKKMLENFFGLNFKKLRALVYNRI
jgi:DNA-directed RNA polymerase specialized sigma24 family protein